MELKNIAKKAALVALVASFAAACTHTETTTTKDGMAKTKTVRSKTSTYSTK